MTQKRLPRLVIGSLQLRRLGMQIADRDRLIHIIVGDHLRYVPGLNLPSRRLTEHSAINHQLPVQDRGNKLQIFGRIDKINSLKHGAGNAV